MNKYAGPEYDTRVNTIFSFEETKTAFLKYCRTPTKKYAESSVISLAVFHAAITETLNSSKDTLHNECNHETYIGKRTQKKHHELKERAIHLHTRYVRFEKGGAFPLESAMRHKAIVPKVAKNLHIFSFKVFKDKAEMSFNRL